MQRGGRQRVEQVNSETGKAKPVKGEMFQKNEMARYLGTRAAGGWVSRNS